MVSQNGELAHDDLGNWNHYSRYMAEQPAHLILTIDTKDPIEIGDFVGQFTALASQYEKFMREAYPNADGEAKVFVSEVKEGSIVAILIGLVRGAGQLIEGMEGALALEDFVKRYKDRLSHYFKKGGRDIAASKGDLKDFHNTIAAIANDPNGSAKLEAAYYEDGQKQIRAAFKFTTQEARKAEIEIETHKIEMETATSADYHRVLMTFVRSDIRESKTGKPSGELVSIERIGPKPLPLVYASVLAEERIKHEIRDRESVYKKGFDVDVNVETRNGKPIAYRVTNLHGVIDLPD